MTFKKPATSGHEDCQIFENPGLLKVRILYGVPHIYTVRILKKLPPA